jgi:hypothetical protein
MTVVRLRGCGASAGRQPVACPAEARKREGWRKRLGVEPSLPRKGAATDFEDREGHRAPFTSVYDSISASQ